MFHDAFYAKQSNVRSILLAVFVLPASAAIAQPAGVTVTDLGNFAGSAATTQTQNVSITAAAPVAWFKIRLPRIAPPHRYLDISTSGVGFADTELGLFAADGTLIANDDDDGAQNFSALSFGITSVNAAGRVPPIADAGQTAGAPNDGRDGTLSGNPQVGLLGTAADYYISVSRFDSSFSNGFGVTPPVGGSTLATLLTVRMNTPGGQVAPTVTGADITKVIGENNIFAAANTSLSATSVTIDVSAVGGPSNAGLFGSSGNWDGTVFVPPFTSVGVFPIVYRASNAIGDVTIDEATLTVRPRAYFCQFAGGAPISTTPGTTIYTYSTTLGDVDGPWTNACFSFTPTGNDVWFRFRPAQSGSLTLSTCNSDTGAVGGQPDTLLGFRGRCDDAGFSTCGDDVGGCGVGTRLNNIPVTAGLEYNIAVRAFSTDIVNGRLAVTFAPGCDSIDFNGDGLFPDDSDLIDFLRVLAGGTCSTGTCSDIDFNNDGLFPDDADLVAFLTVLAGGAC